MLTMCAFCTSILYEGKENLPPLYNYISVKLTIHILDFLVVIDCHLTRVGLQRHHVL